MISALLFSLLAATSTEIWTTSTFCPLFDASRGTIAASPEARLYVARGECESFLLFVRAGRKGIDRLDVVGDPTGEIPAPTVYAVGPASANKPSPRAIGAAAAWPDVLIPFGPGHPSALAAGETAAFWVSYAVPRDVLPGVHTGQVRVLGASRRARTVPVRLEVFAFTLPEVSRLRVYTALDRGALRRVYGLDDSLEAWKPVYDALAPFRLSYPVWDGGELVRIDASGRADTGPWKEHLEYAVTASRMAAIDASANGHATLLVPDPRPGELQDALQLLLHDMGNWLAARGWLERAFVEVRVPPRRDQWLATLATLHRVWRADKRFKRLIAAPLHPQWERYAEIWAAPFLGYEPEYARRLLSGESLVEEEPLPYRVRASSNGTSPEGVATLPEDACDGARVSAWLPERQSGSRSANWIALDFDTPTPLRSVVIFWTTGRAPRDLLLETTYDGRAYAPSTVIWQHHDLLGVYPRMASVGTLGYPKDVLGLRIGWRGGAADTPGIAELRLNHDEEDAPPIPSAPPVSPWLLLQPDSFPSLALDAHPAEARLVAWVCHSRGLEGCHAGTLNWWPPDWSAGGSAETLGEAARQPLVYPGVETCIPSARLLRLRDGIEDFEYLAALRDAVREGRLPTDEARRILPGMLFGPQTTPQELTNLAERIEQIRVQIGRALDALPPQTE